METPPPLPSEDPPKSPSPPLPPPSIQASNHDHERLDFETDAGGNKSSTDNGPPSKRKRLDENQMDGDIFAEDEGPDTLLGSGLAAELLEEGEIFDSESILSRNGSTKSNLQCQDQEGSQATNSPVIAAEDSNSMADFDDSCDTVVSSKKNEAGSGTEMLVEDVSEQGHEAKTNIKENSQESTDDVMVDELLGKTKECSLKPAIPSYDQEEFEVIDDLESDGEGGGEQNYRGHDSDDDSNDDSDDAVYDEDEIDALLDEEMDKNAPKEKDSEKSHIAGAVLDQKEKVLLVDRCTDPFDILPENWVMVTHNSGMPVYLHKKTRVCTLSKPYFLGPSSARKHDIPISAIPCLQYRRALEKEAAVASEPSSVTEASDSVKEEEQEPTCEAPRDDTTPESTNQQISSQVSCQSGISLPKLGVRVETAKDHEKQNSLGYLEVREYCQKLFQFKTITVKRFKTWKDRRKHTSRLKKVARPSLPSSTKLIRCAIPADKDSKGAKRKEFVLNPAGKSDICILHEYVQQALRVQPRYIFEELQNSQTPFGATVLIGGEKYGSGFSSSKKGAKLEAAKQTLAILIPEMNKLKEEEKDDSSTSDLSLFDTIKIEDPRVTELCIKAGQPGPFQVLCECLKRNYGVGDTQVQMEMKALKHQKSEFIMKVGKHEACVVCKNKREGKQQAAQAILQKMHPHIHTWGSLLRLYDRSTITQSQSRESLWCQVDDMSSYTETAISCCSDPIPNTRSLSADAECQVELEISESWSQTDFQTESDQSGVRTDVTDETNYFLANQQNQHVPLCQGQQEAVPSNNESGVLNQETDCALAVSHRAVQTEWLGQNLYHKTTQCPEVKYSDDNEPQSSVVTVMSPTVSRSSPQYSAAVYRCAEVRSASGVIYGFCPRAVNSAMSDSLPSSSLSNNPTNQEFIQTSTRSVLAEFPEMLETASQSILIGGGPGLGPSGRIPSVVLPTFYQYNLSQCVPSGNYIMMPYPSVPQRPDIMSLNQQTKDTDSH